MAFVRVPTVALSALRSPLPRPDRARRSGSRQGLRPASRSAGRASERPAAAPWIESSAGSRAARNVMEPVAIWPEARRAGMGQGHPTWGLPARWSQMELAGARWWSRAKGPAGWRVALAPPALGSRRLCWLGAEREWAGWSGPKEAPPALVLWQAREQPLTRRTGPPVRRAWRQEFVAARRTRLPSAGAYLQAAAHKTSGPAGPGQARALVRLRPAAGTG